jgi:hypothetical protein
MGGRSAGLTRLQLFLFGDVVNLAGTHLRVGYMFNQWRRAACGM